VIPISDSSSFIQHQKIISSALSLCLKILDGSMGLDIQPSESRLAKNPIDVIGDMADVLEAAAVLIGKAQKETRKQGGK
jgi:hypothetical protein